MEAQMGENEQEYQLSSLELNSNSTQATRKGMDKTCERDHNLEIKGRGDRG